jgi:dCMP deaminase
MKFGRDKMKQKKLNKYDKAYLRIATEWGSLSHCKRKQVGAIIVAIE